MMFSTRAGAAALAFVFALSWGALAVAEEFSLAGKWTGALVYDEAKLKANAGKWAEEIAKEKPLSVEDAADFVEAINEAFKSFELEADFEASGKYELTVSFAIAPKQVTRGTWKLLKEDGRYYLESLQDARGEDGPVERAPLTVKGADLVRLEADDQFDAALPKQLRGVLTGVDLKRVAAEAQK